jgi:hypothetical protein
MTTKDAPDVSRRPVGVTQGSLVAPTSNASQDGNTAPLPSHVDFGVPTRVLSDSDGPSPTVAMQHYLEALNRSVRAELGMAPSVQEEYPVNREVYPGADAFVLDPETTPAPLLAASRTRELMVALLTHDMNTPNDLRGEKHGRLFVELFREVNANVAWDDGEDGLTVTWDALAALFLEQDPAKD